MALCFLGLHPCRRLTSFSFPPGSQTWSLSWLLYLGVPLLNLPEHPCPGEPNTSLEFSSRLPGSSIILGSVLTWGWHSQGPSCPALGPGKWRAAAGALPVATLYNSVSSFPFPFSSSPHYSNSGFNFSQMIQFGGLGFLQENFCDPLSTGTCLPLLEKRDSGRSADPVRLW